MNMCETVASVKPDIGNASKGLKQTGNTLIRTGTDWISSTQASFATLPQCPLGPSRRSETVSKMASTMLGYPERVPLPMGHSRYDVIIL